MKCSRLDNPNNPKKILFIKLDMEKINKEELELRRARLRDDEGNLIGCLKAVSIVTKPAIELNYMLFNGQEVEHKFQITSEELMEITGPAMLPDKYILRKDIKTKKYYNVVFSKQDVKDAAELFLSSANHNQANFEHDQSSFTNKIRLAESWIVVDPKMDKAVSLGFSSEDINEGTWFITYKVLDRELWEELKKSDFRGLSVELGGYEEVVYSREDFSQEQIDEIENIINEAPTKLVRSKYTLLYNILKDIVFDEKIGEDSKYKIIRKLLSKL